MQYYTKQIKGYKTNYFIVQFQETEKEFSTLYFCIWMSKTLKWASIDRLNEDNVLLLSNVVLIIHKYVL